jgi:hypothetical protein
MEDIADIKPLVIVDNPLVLVDDIVLICKGIPLGVGGPQEGEIGIVRNVDALGISRQSYACKQQCTYGKHAKNSLEEHGTPSSLRNIDAESIAHFDKNVKGEMA